MDTKKVRELESYKGYINHMAVCNQCLWARISYELCKQGFDKQCEVYTEIDREGV